ncbi:MAG TPA: alpha/beta hydrolase-fold protein [Acidimicrobiales bacterium]|nr:alpha/beta hydrolase-fold protein [Acidimicrobiales bacterium]
MGKRIGALLAACFVLMTIAPRAGAAPDEVTPAEDNPPGCTTAGFGNSSQCGAQGRNNFDDANHVAPIDECKTTVAPSGSTITRILPNGPRRADNSLAFISGACVYLPPGYATSGLHYPVLYLLHGGGGDEQDWANPHDGDIRKTLDDFYAADASHAVIAVMPDGNDGNWHDYADGSFMIETYVLRYLIPYVDRHFRTIADRRGRAVDGLSNGGYGALELAAKAPDLFVAAGGMSSNVGGRDMSGFGNPEEFGAFYYGNTPTPLASNLDNVAVTMDLANGCSNQQDLSTNLCLLVAVDTAFRYDNEAFRDAMAKVEHVGAFEYRESEGEHEWRWWTTWFRERQLPFIYQRLAQPAHTPTTSPLPASFRYRSIASRFSVYGYDVTVTRAHPEFLDLANVSAGGLTVTGTGTATITTAARYVPGAAYAVTTRANGVDRDALVKAGRDGRLTFSVDLGPSHDAEEYSPPARAEDAAGTYAFATREIAIRPIPIVRAAVEARSGTDALPRTGGSAEPLEIGALLLTLALAGRVVNRLRTAE